MSCMKYVKKLKARAKKEHDETAKLYQRAKSTICDLIQNKEKSAGDATSQVILRKIVVAHVVTSVENAAKSAILR